MNGKTKKFLKKLRLWPIITILLLIVVGAFYYFGVQLQMDEPPPSLEIQRESAIYQGMMARGVRVALDLYGERAFLGWGTTESQLENAESEFAGREAEWGEETPRFSHRINNDERSPDYNGGFVLVHSEKKLTFKDVFDRINPKARAAVIATWNNGTGRWDISENSLFEGVRARLNQVSINNLDNMEIEAGQVILIWALGNHNATNSIVEIWDLQNYKEKSEVKTDVCKAENGWMNFVAQQKVYDEVKDCMGRVRRVYEYGGGSPSDYELIYHKDQKMLNNMERLNVFGDSNIYWVELIEEEKPDHKPPVQVEELSDVPKVEGVKAELVEGSLTATKYNLRLSWDPVAYEVEGAEVKYEIEYDFKVADREWTRIPNIETEQVNIDGLSAELTYEFKVRAIAERGEERKTGEWSNIIEHRQSRAVTTPISGTLIGRVKDGKATRILGTTEVTLSWEAPSIIYLGDGKTIRGEFINLKYFIEAEYEDTRTGGLQIKKEIIEGESDTKRTFEEVQGKKYTSFRIYAYSEEIEKEKCFSSFDEEKAICRGDFSDPINVIIPIPTSPIPSSPDITAIDVEFTRYPDLTGVDLTSILNMDEDGCGEGMRLVETRNPVTREIISTCIPDVGEQETIRFFTDLRRIAYPDRVQVIVTWRATTEVNRNKMSHYFYRFNGINGSQEWTRVSNNNETEGGFARLTIDRDKELNKEVDLYLEFYGVMTDDSISATQKIKIPTNFEFL